MKNENKAKRYYWIKLKDSFFTSDTVDFLMSQKNGANYIVLYQMLCLKAVNTNGVLARQLGEIMIPFDAEKIQRDCKYFDIDTIRVALELYKKLGLIAIEENGVIHINNFDNMIGSETYGAIEKRQQKQAKLLEDRKGIEKGIENFYQDIDNRDKILDIRDKDIDNKESTKEKSKRFLPPTLEEVKSYCDERHNNVDPQRFIDFYESKGWMVGSNKMKSWKACVRTWEGRENKTGNTAQQRENLNQRDYKDLNALMNNFDTDDFDL